MSEYVTITMRTIDPEVLALLYPGMQVIGCESSLIGCEPFRDRVDEPDISLRRYIKMIISFIHSFILNQVPILMV